MTDALVEQGLRASAFVFGEAKKRIRSSTESIGLDELREIKRAAVSMNTSFTRYVKLAREREDRLLIELHLMRHAVQRDATDRDANRARVYEMLRKYREEASPQPLAHNKEGQEQPSEAPVPAQSQNPYSVLTSANAGAQAVDRAMSAVARVEAAIASLSPTGVVHTHGAGLLAAATTRRSATASSASSASSSLVPLVPLPPPP